MPTVTVQGGGNSVLALQYTSNDVVAVATQLAQQISAAVQSGTLPLTYYNGIAPSSGVLAIASVDNQVTLQPNNHVVIVNSGPAGYGVLRANVVNGAPNSSGLQLLADSGGLDFAAGVNSTGTVIAGDGPNRLATASTGSATFNFITGSGNDTISAATGNNYVGAGTGQNLVLLGTGNNYVMVSGQDTVGGGPGTDPASRGTDTISVNGPGSALVWGGNSNIYMVNGSASSTVYGGSGSDTVNAGAGGGLFVAGYGGNSQLYANAGPSTLVGNATGDTLTVAGQSFNDLYAGAGNETLTGANSAGTNAYVAGTGNTVMVGGAAKDYMYGNTSHATMTGGLGGDEFIFFAGLAGSNVITDFNPSQGDFLYLPGFDPIAERAFAVANQAHSGGNTIVLLSDNTTITFLGVAAIGPQSFYVG